MFPRLDSQSCCIHEAARFQLKACSIRCGRARCAASFRHHFPRLCHPLWSGGANSAHPNIEELDHLARDENLFATAKSFASCSFLLKPIIAPIRKPYNAIVLEPEKPNTVKILSDK